MAWNLLQSSIVSGAVNVSTLYGGYPGWQCHEDASASGIKSIRKVGQFFYAVVEQYLSTTYDVRSYVVRASDDAFSQNYEILNYVSGYLIGFDYLSGPGLFVILVTTPDGIAQASSSPDGVTWTTRYSAAEGTWPQFERCAATSLGFVAVGSLYTTDSYPIVLTSANGVDWNLSLLNAPNGPARAICESPSGLVFIAASDYSTYQMVVMSSPDLTTWTVRHSVTAADMAGYIGYANGDLYAVAGNEFIKSQDDGQTWSSLQSTGVFADTRFTFLPSANLFVCASHISGVFTILTSPDFVTWTARANIFKSDTTGTEAAGYPADITAVEYVAAAGKVYVHSLPISASQNGVDWTISFGVKPGDLAVIGYAYRGVSDVTGPGYILATNQNTGNLSTTNSTATSSVGILYSVLGSSLPTFRLTRTGDLDAMRMACAFYRGADPTNPLQSASSRTLSTASTLVTTDSIDTTDQDQLIFAVFAGSRVGSLSSGIYAVNDPSEPSPTNGAVPVSPSANWTIINASSSYEGADIVMLAFQVLKSQPGSTGEFRLSHTVSSRHSLAVASFRMAPQATGVTITSLTATEISQTTARFILGLLRS